MELKSRKKEFDSFWRHVMNHSRPLTVGGESGMICYCMLSAGRREIEICFWWFIFSKVLD